MKISFGISENIGIESITLLSKSEVSGGRRINWVLNKNPIIYLLIILKEMIEVTYLDRHFHKYFEGAQQGIWQWKCK